MADCRAGLAIVCSRSVAQPEDRKLALFRTIASIVGSTPGPTGAGQIGFVSHGGFHQRYRQSSCSLPIAVRVGIGFVLPTPSACQIRHNSSSTQYLPSVLLREELALFRTFWPGVTGRGDLADSCPRVPACENWLRFARLLRSSAVLPVRPAVAFPGRGGANWVCLTQWARAATPPARVHLHPCGQIGFVCTSGPSDDPAGDLARPRPLLSLRADWLCLARIRSEYRVYADRTALSRSKAVLRTVQDRLWDILASGIDLRRGHVVGRSRRNPPKSWSLSYYPLFCCPNIIRMH